MSNDNAKNLQIEINDKLRKLDIDSLRIFSETMDIKIEDNVDFDSLDIQIKDLESQFEALCKIIDSANSKGSTLYKSKLKELKSKKRKLYYKIAKYFLLFILVFSVLPIVAFFNLFLMYDRYMPYLKQIKMIKKQIKSIKNGKAVSVDNEKLNIIKQTLENAKRFVDSKRRKKELSNSLNVENYMLKEDYSLDSRIDDNEMKLLLK